MGFIVNSNNTTMKYKLIKTIVNVKTHAIQQSVDICNNEEELTRYWKELSSYNNMIYSGVSDKIDDAEYYIQSGKIKDTDCIITVMQYTLNYLP